VKTAAVIWDFDGVILDNELLHLDAELGTARAFGLPLTREVALEYLGARLEEYFRALLERFGPFPAKEKTDGSATLPVMLAKHYETLRRFYREVFPLTAHVREVLDSLGKMYPMGVATNRERELLSLSFERHGLWGCFGCVVCAEDVGRGKPDPEPFLKAARLLSVDPRATAAIEDTENGFKAAKAAGMHLVARKAAHNSHIDFSPADFVVEDLREIPRILRRP
jgi:HAD superfamily hydrolase (TIGR01509 family)